MALYQFDFAPQNLSITDIHAFYSGERKLYSRMVFDLHMDPVQSMEIIAFWLWLEEKEKSAVIALMNSFDDPKLQNVALFGRDFVAALRLDSPFKELNVGLHQKASQGIKHYLQTVCLRALADIKKKAEGLAHLRHIEMLVNQMSQTHIQPANSNNYCVVNNGDILSHSSNSSIGNSNYFGMVDLDRRVELGYPFDLSMLRNTQPIEQGLPAMPPIGNAGIVIAEPQQPVRDNLPDDERTMFVTFSNGYPLTKDELLSFFMRHFGAVQSVNTQSSDGIKPPQYAYVTFYTLATVFRVLNGAPKAKFIINGKHLWARRYIPRRKLLNTNVNDGAHRFRLPMNSDSAGLELCLK